jgi:hypothetical protein
MKKRVDHEVLIRPTHYTKRNEHMNEWCGDCTSLHPVNAFSSIVSSADSDAKATEIKSEQYSGIETWSTE